MTTAMVRCTQPGCDGMIKDGYCDTCALATLAASSGPSAPSVSARRIELVDLANAIRPRTLT